MNRRSFFTKLAVGIVAAPAIAKAVAQHEPAPHWPEFDEDELTRLYAEVIEKHMRRAAALHRDRLVRAWAEHYHL